MARVGTLFKLRAMTLGVSLSALLGVSSAEAQANAADIASEDEAPAPHPSGDREAARAAFERGLSLVRETRYAEAKTAFLEAYQAHPHYLVLYNVAQADAQLGNLESAITYLERFLLEGAGLLSAERERHGQEQLEELRKRLSAERGVTEAETTDRAALPGATVEQGSPDVAPSRRAHELPLRSAEPPASVLPPASSISESARESAAPGSLPVVAPEQPAPTGVDKPWGILLGATGIALLGVAAGLYVWNDARHDQWRQESQTLNAIPERDQALASDLELWQQAKANNELLESIQRVDVVTLVAAGVGAVALGAGAWNVLATHSPAPALVASGAVLSWRSSW